MGNGIRMNMGKSNFKLVTDNFNKSERVSAVSFSLLICAGIFFYSICSGELTILPIISSIGVIISLGMTAFTTYEQIENEKKTKRRDRLNVALSQLESAINGLVLYKVIASRCLEPMYTGEATINIFVKHISGTYSMPFGPHIEYQDFNPIVVQLLFIQETYHKDEHTYEHELSLFYHRYFRVAHNIKTIYQWLEKNNKTIYDSLELKILENFLNNFIKKKEDFNPKLEIELF